MLLRVILVFLIFAGCCTLSGCSLPLSIDDDVLHVSGGIVSPATTTQRANSVFQTQDGDLGEGTAAVDGATLIADSDDQEVISDTEPPKNFRPLLP